MTDFTWGLSFLFWLWNGYTSIFNAKVVCKCVWEFSSFQAYFFGRYINIYITVWKVKVFVANAMPKHISCMGWEFVKQKKKMSWCQFSFIYSSKNMMNTCNLHCTYIYIHFFYFFSTVGWKSNEASSEFMERITYFGFFIQTTLQQLNHGVHIG